MSKTEIISCLSIQQPYIDEIFFGDKFIENRSWRTSHRGELWLHSSKIDSIAIQDALECEHYDYAKHSKTGLATGVIFGRVCLHACVASEKLFSIATESACKAMGKKPEHRPEFNEEDEESLFLRELLLKLSPIGWRHFCFSKYAWIFGQAQMLDSPIPVSGKLRIWEHQVESERLIMALPEKRSWRQAKTSP